MPLVNYSSYSYRSLSELQSPFFSLSLSRATSLSLSRYLPIHLSIYLSIHQSEWVLMILFFCLGFSPSCVEGVREERERDWETNKIEQKKALMDRPDFFVAINLMLWLFQPPFPTFSSWRVQQNGRVLPTFFSLWSLKFCFIYLKIIYQINEIIKYFLSKL